MALADPVSAADVPLLQGLISTAEEVLIQVSTDLDADARFGRQWVLVTPERILVVPTNTGTVGKGSPPGVAIPPDVATAEVAISEVAISELKSVKTEPLVGAGILELERLEGPPILVHYSNSQNLKFAEVARGIEQLRTAEEFQVTERLERLRCEKCGRLLPEKDGACPACVRRLHTLKRIMAYMAPYRGRAALLALSSVVAAAAQLIPPQVIRQMIDGVLVPSVEGEITFDAGATLLGWLVLALVGVRVISWLSEIGHGWLMAWMSARVTADIRGNLYRRLEMLSMQFYDKRKVGSLISRVTHDAEMLQDFLVEGLPYLIINGLMVVGVLGFLMTTSAEVTLLLLIPVPAMLLWSLLFWRRMRNIFHKWGRGWAALSARLNESLNGIRVVKAFAQERREVAAFDEKSKALGIIMRRTARNWMAMWSTLGLVTGSGMIVMWYFGGLEVLDENMTFGDLMLFYSYIWLIYGPLQWFAEVNSWMTRAFAGAERIFEVIDTKPEAYEDPDAVALPSMHGAVRFRRVTFGYDKSKPVLHDVEIEARPGEMIGLVGKSGVGKTTTINLIARFYDVDRGSVEIDGVDIRRIRLEDLRRQIGIVPQDPVLFSGTIAENISYGKPGASMEEIMDAARVAHAHGFILAKPDGYDTRVGERGLTLSGGEKQRLAIARSVLHDPKILILDEATSSVDVETEKQIQEAIAALIKGRTTFAIAHRLSTLRNADRLVLLDGGKVSEMGTHEELMERQGAFSELVKLQQEVAEIIAVAD